MEAGSGEGLQTQTTRGFAWQFSGNAVRALSNFGIGVVLARILAPEDFGVVGLAYIATGLALVIADIGLVPSLMQRKDITDVHVRVCFTVSALLSVLLAALLIASSDLIGAVVNDSRVSPVISVLSLGLVVSGLGVTSNALLLRGLRFRELVSIEIMAAIFGYGGVALTLAFQGFGYWALVAGSIVQSVIGAVTAYAVVRHPLSPSLRRQELKELLHVGIGMSMASLANFVAQRIDYFIVGRTYSASALGFYSRAFTLMELPLTFFGSTLSRVLFPAAARVQDDDERFKRAYLVAFRFSAFISLSISLSIVVLAPELVIALFGDKWAPTIPLLQILALFGMFRMTYNTGSAFLRARGRAYHLLASELLFVVAVLGAAAVAVRYSDLSGIAWAVGGAVSLMWAVVTMLANRAANVTTWVFLRSMASAVVPAAGIGVLLFVLTSALRAADSPPLVVLLLGGTTSVFLFLLGLLWHVKREALAVPAWVADRFRGFPPIFAMRSRQ